MKDENNGSRIFLRVFSLGDLIALGSMLVVSTSAFATLAAKHNAHENAELRTYAELRTDIAAVPMNSRDIAVLKRDVARAEADRLELKHDLLRRLDSIDEQNREILRHLNGIK